MWVASTLSRAGLIRLENKDGFLWLSPRPHEDGTPVRPHKVSYKVSNAFSNYLTSPPA